MYCTVIVPLSFGDDGSHLVVTEVERVMGEDRFDVLAGYVIEGYDFSTVHNEHYMEIQNALEKWWREE